MFKHCQKFQCVKKGFERGSTDHLSKKNLEKYFINEANIKQHVYSGPAFITGVTF